MLHFLLQTKGRTEAATAGAVRAIYSFSSLLCNGLFSHLFSHFCLHTIFLAGWCQRYES